MATKSENADIRELQTQMTDVKKSFDDFKNNEFKEVKDDIKAIRDAIDNGTTANDRRYAAKWVQTTVAFVIALIVGAVIAALLALVIIPAANTDKTTGSSTTTQTTTTTPTGSTSTSRTVPSSTNSAPADNNTGGSVQVTLPKVQ